MSKTLTDFKIQLDEVQGEGRYVYGSDSKRIPDIDANGRPVWRKVRARRIQVGKSAPTPVGVSAPDVGDSDSQDRDNGLEIYTKYYKKYVKALKGDLKEDMHTESTESDPPYVLVLKRKNIRLYPNNMKVALYYNEKLQKYFSVPYSDSKVHSPIQAEETNITFEEQNVVSNFLNVFCNLSEENQQKMLDMINGDTESYNKIKNFALGITDESNTTD